MQPNASHVTQQSNIRLIRTGEVIKYKPKANNCRKVIDKNNIITSANDNFRVRANTKSVGCFKFCNNKEVLHATTSCDLRSTFKVFSREYQITNSDQVDDIKSRIETTCPLQPQK